MLTVQRPPSRGKRPPSGAPGLGIDPGWDAQRVMRWVLGMKREANQDEIDAVFAAIGERPIVGVSTRDPWWGARPIADR